MAAGRYKAGQPCEHCMSTLPALALAAFVLMPVASFAADADVTIPSGNHALSGTLSLPEGDGPFPAVILISGSGRSDRNEALPGVTSFQPFKVLAGHLADAGIAVLRYDDRGVGESTGDFQSATSEDFAEDVEAVLAYLQSRREIDTRRIGLVGHSEGGMIAPMVAADNPEDIAFVVAMAPTTVPGFRILSWQLDNLLAGSNLTEDQKAAAHAQEIRSLEWVVGEDWISLQAHLRDQYAAMPEAQRDAIGSESEFIEQGMLYYQGWLYFFATHDPADDWRRLAAPALVLFGGLDQQVPAEMNAAALRLTIEDRDDASVTIVDFPTANHLFQDAVTGAVTEYGMLPDTFAAGFLPAISDWILERAAE
jgi:pimeloyl-ACP methyl ester carboxylesterase